MINLDQNKVTFLYSINYLVHKFHSKYQETYYIKKTNSYSLYISNIKPKPIR